MAGFRVARASRRGGGGGQAGLEDGRAALAKASRLRELPSRIAPVCVHAISLDTAAKFVLAGRQDQHTRRACSPRMQTSANRTVIDCILLLLIQFSGPLQLAEVQSLPPPRQSFTAVISTSSSPSSPFVSRRFTLGSVANAFRMASRSVQLSALPHRNYGGALSIRSRNRREARASRRCRRRMGGGRTLRRVCREVARQRWEGRSRRNGL